MEVQGIRITLMSELVSAGSPLDYMVVLSQEGRNHDRAHEELILYCEDKVSAKSLFDTLVKAINEYTYY